MYAGALWLLGWWWKPISKSDSSSSFLRYRLSGICFVMHRCIKCLFSSFFFLHLTLRLNIPITWKDLSFISVLFSSDSFRKPPRLSGSVSHSLSTVIAPSLGLYWVLKDWMWESEEGLSSHLSSAKPSAWHRCCMSSAWCMTPLICRTSLHEPESVLSAGGLA